MISYFKSGWAKARPLFSIVLLSITIAMATLWGLSYFRHYGLLKEYEGAISINAGSVVIEYVDPPILKDDELPPQNFLHYEWQSPPSTSRGDLGFGHHFIVVRPELGFALLYSETSWTVCCPLWFLMLLTGIPGVLMFRTTHRNAHRRKHGLCMSCGYDLRGSAERCPECGKPSEGADDRSPGNQDAVGPRQRSDGSAAQLRLTK